MAAQLMCTNGFCHRGLDRWINSAVSSLPVPVSPVMSTVHSVTATCATYERISRMRGLSPIRYEVPSAARPRATPSGADEARQRLMLAVSWSKGTGCVK